jgi:hypothetical protein
MNKVLLFCLFQLPLLLSAQSLKGSLSDASGNALPYATLQLLKADSSLFKIEMTSSDGSFEFRNLEEKQYYLSISFIGYETIQKSIDLFSGDLNLGSITLKQQSTELKEVSIYAEKPLIEVEPDKTVFNVSKNLGSTGDNGVELLRKAPGLQVDNDDNIILEGKSGVTIYINGKQSYLQGNDLSNYLKSLRAEEIEKVEMITQPSSKYDAAGSAGILNIVLKKEKGLGTKGNVSNTLTIGDYARNNTSLTLNHRSKNYALFGTFSHFEGKMTRFFNMYRVQGLNIFDGETNSTVDMSNNQLNIGGDYYLSKKSTLSATLGGNFDSRSTSTNSVTPMSQTDDYVTDSVLLAPNRDNNEVNNITASINYTLQDTSGRSFSVDVDVVNYSSDRDSYQPNIYTSPNQEQVLNQNINFQETPIEIQVYSSKVDYEQKLWKGVVSLGLKASQVNTENIFDFYEVKDGTQSLNRDRSNTFDYTELITAAYINYKYQWKKWKFQGGLRAEQTNSKGDLQSFTTNANKVVKREYLNLFPSAGATYQLNRNNSTALIYSRRIQRPNYQNLNPFETQVNELSFRRGNPFLQPQFTENIKLSNTYKYTLTTSLSFSYVSDYFAEVTEAEGERRSFINTRNVADQYIYNFSVSYPKKIRDWWNVYASAYAYYTQFTANNPAFIPIDRTVFGGFGQSTFTLPKNFKAEVSGWYNSPSIWRGTYKTKSIGAINLGIQKTWKAWSAKISVNDIFYTAPWRADTRYGDLFLTGTGGSDSRNVRFFLSYSFGEKEVKEAKKRNSGAESERSRIGTSE